MLRSVLSNIVSRCVLGRKVEEENGQSMFGELARGVVENFSAFYFEDMFSCLGWLDVVTGKIGRSKASFRALDAYFDQVIEEHRISESDDGQSDRKDFVDILLQLQKHGKLEIEITQDNIKAILLVSLSYSLSHTHTDIAFSPFGDYSRQAKKICVQELLSQRRVQAFKFVREEEVANIVAKIRLSSLSGAAVDLTEMFAAISNIIISKSALGRVYEGDGDKNFAALSKTATELSGAFYFEDLLPILGWMDNLTGLAAKLKSTSTALHNFFDQVIEEHQVSKSYKDKSEKKDFVDLLLHLQKYGGLDIDLTHESIKGILLVSFYSLL
ncbi:hypothetical protein JRO89_XS13G0086100 [Xanthoceras sorbifolium]|uniref:Uncharacterized protein n=1 Tax=Xanthoceras sorbifolium TaxID=99658 RepID=A0ABQ8H7B9_9ROSI|nr:hypothetical protein JRO89_XS13G0086100 [Xanthoceras sorbifolium]